MIKRVIATVFRWPVIIVACLTLGLAPFSPEPHIWAGLRWVAGGAVGMEWINWLDLVLHGLPWILLVLKVTSFFITKDK